MRIRIACALAVALLVPMTATAAPAPTHRIPDAFPLLSGYPRNSAAEPGEGDGRHGPSRTMKRIVPRACGARVPVPHHTDLLRAGWTNPEDYRERQLVTFGGPRRAQAYADDLLDLFRACPADGPRDDREHSRLTASDQGDAGGVVTSTYTYRGSPRPGLQLMHVVRVGSAVLVATTYDEGGAGRHPRREARAERRRTAHQIEGVVAAMADLK